MYRIFVGGIHMEANSFNPVLATTETFTTKLEDGEMRAMRGTSLELGGVYACFEHAVDVNMLPGYFAQACTSGPVKGEDYDFLCGKLFSALSDAGPVDGVLLVLHGAMQSEFIDDCEGHIIKTIRGMVGEGVPICASLDLHALITGDMLENLDGLCGYFTYPHVDHFETGRRAAESLLHLLHTGAKPYKVCRRIPLIMSCENSNTIDSPMVPVIEKVKALLARDHVLSGSFFMAQPWLDSPGQGCSVCIFTDTLEAREAADVELISILRYIWDNRELFYPPMPDIRQALVRIDSMKKPVLLVDYGDVPNAGGSGDSTVVLQALLDAKLGGLSVVVMADAESTDQAAAVGEGNTADFMIGGFGKPGEFNARIPVTAKVLRLNAEPFVHLGPAQKGFVNRPGMRALLQAGNVRIILCRQVTFSHDRGMLLTMDIAPDDMDVIAMRATHSFMSCYADVMGSWLYVDTPGYSTRDLKTLPYKHCQRPIYPLDDLTQFQATEVI